MKQRIIRSIRYFETKPDSYQGKFDGIVGNIFKSTDDTKYISERIARKLHELGFISGKFDHIYICLSDKIDPENIIENDKFHHDQITTFEYGINPAEFNDLSETDKDKRILEITFSVLHHIYKSDEIQIMKIDLVKKLINIEGKNLLINYRIKETNKYKVVLDFQIHPQFSNSKLLVYFINKDTQNASNFEYEIFDYDDLYELINVVKVENNKIIFQPKRNQNVEFLKRKYTNFPFTINL